MKRIALLVFAVLTLSLSACSDSDDGGGTTGGYGTIDNSTAAHCRDAAGTYRGPDYVATFNSDCTGYMTTPYGDAKMKVTKFNSTGLNADFRVVSGPARGECGRIEMTAVNYQITGQRAYQTNCRI